MGKKKVERKIRKALKGTCEDNMCEDAGDFLHDVYNISDKIRTVSPTSNKMNNLSEAFDDMVNILVKMNPEEIQIIQRLW